MIKQIIPFSDIDREVEEFSLREEIKKIEKEDPQFKNPQEKAIFLDQCANYILYPKKYSNILRGLKKFENPLTKLNQFYTNSKEFLK